MLNKKMMKIIQKIYAISDFSIFASAEARQKMIRVFLSEPNLEKYGINSRGVKTIQAALQSPVFGGSIFSPIKGARSGIGGLQERRHDGKKIDKRNSLRQIIASMNIETHKGGGFYTLRNIKASKDTFLDIQILIDKGVQTSKDLKTLQ